MTAMDGAMGMVTAMAMDGTAATAIEGGMATRGWQQRGVAQLQRDGNNGNGFGKGDGEERLIR
jgi:hypothetical protein